VIFDEKGKARGQGPEVPEQIPLPVSPPVVEEKAKDAGDKKKAKEEDKSKKKDRFQGFLTNVRSHIPLSFGKKSEQTDASSHMHDIATAVKTGEALVVPVTKEEEEKEKNDMTTILDQLNLSAVNNRAFSFSKESNKLFEQFTQILKDLINGVPTAYDDLEKLLTDSDKQLKEMFGNLPPFLQNLVKSLPSKMTASIAPGLMAAASEKPGADAKTMGLDPAAYAKKRAKRSIPALKNLVKTDAIVAMLKSILNFLKFRFPAFISGTNVLLSLAVFLLLFIFWYCHKRGRETRLEKERLAAEGESDLESVSDISESIVLEDSSPDARKLEEALKHPAPSSVPLPETPNQK